METIAAVHVVSTTASFIRFIYGEGLGRSAAAVNADTLIYIGLLIELAVKQYLHLLIKNGHKKSRNVATPLLLYLP